MTNNSGSSAMATCDQWHSLSGFFFFYLNVSEGPLKAHSE